MRLTLVTYGSEGDTRPFVGLSLALKQAGHDVHLLAGPATIHNARAHGVACSELPGDIRTTLPLADPQTELTGSVVLNAVKSGLRMVNEHAEDWVRTIVEHASGSDGVLYAGLALVSAEAVANALGIPGIAMWLQPTTPTRAFASPTVPWRNLPGPLNRLTYRVSPEAMMRRFYGKSSRRAVDQVFGRQSKSIYRHPKLYGFSSHLVTRPADWPAADQIAGHWSQPMGEWEAPASLQDFLAAGPPPIFIGFGAISSFVRGHGLRAIVDAVGARRALFYPGWSNIDSNMLPKNFLVIGDTPHEWLFPRTSLVIHHAGAGTTHTAAASGVPSLPLPIGADQGFWAQSLVTAGIAPGTMPGTRLNSSRLAELIERSSDTAIRSAASKFASLLRAEDGHKNAVRLIETAIRAQ